jgi:hypothetical protein
MICLTWLFRLNPLTSSCWRCVRFFIVEYFCFSILHSWTCLYRLLVESNHAYDLLNQTWRSNPLTSSCWSCGRFSIVNCFYYLIWVFSVLQSWTCLYRLLVEYYLLYNDFVFWTLCKIILLTVYCVCSYKVLLLWNTCIGIICYRTCYKKIVCFQKCFSYLSVFSFAELNLFV